MIDSVGNEIREGDIVRVKHFYSVKRRWEYMYKQIGPYCERYSRTKVYHLPIEDFKANDAYYYTDQETMGECVVVGTSKFDPERPCLKRSKELRD